MSVDVEGAGGLDLDDVDILGLFEAQAGAYAPDPWPVLRELRDAEPVYHGSIHSLIDPSIRPFTGRDTYSILRYDDVTAVLRDYETFSSSVYLETIGRTMGRNVIMMDPPEHRLHRALLQSAFTRNAVEAWTTDLMEPLANEQYIDTFIRQGHADLMQDFALTYPVSVIHRVFGLPSERMMELHTLAVGLLLGQAHPEIAFAASEQLGAFLGGYVAQRRRAPTDDIIGVLIRAEVEGLQLTDAEIVAFLRVLMPAGGETTTRNVANLLLALLRDRDQMQLLLDDRELMPRAIEEALRWEPPSMVQYRLCTKDVEIRGVRIPAGAGVDVWTGSANHDEEVWEDPERFDIRRAPKQHMAFAFGPHMCLGIHMARAETMVAVNALLNRLPNLRLDPAAGPIDVHGISFRSPHTLPVLFDAQ